ncbi:MAG: hypothetical protein ACFBSC_20160 [Microcoleaceae cyanobacterium]
MKKNLDFAGFSIGLIILLLLIFSVLKWIGIPVGNFIDWAIGGAIFWWLLLIVTVPWNVHFDAKEVLATAEESQERRIEVSEQQLQYVQLVARRSLWVALTLHLVSTVGLYGLAAIGVSAVGYWGSGAALLLTGLRPAVRAYQYLAARLAGIRQNITYPRQDIVEVRNRLTAIEAQVQSLNHQLDSENPDSWASSQEKILKALRQDLNRLATELETLKVTNQSEHDRLAKQGEQAIAQLSADSQFLNHARELVRFFKEA